MEEVINLPLLKCLQLNLIHSVTTSETYFSTEMRNAEDYCLS